MNQKIYITISLVIIFAWGMQYFSGAGSLYPSGSYNFQSILAQELYLNPSLEVLEYNNVYINNLKNGVYFYTVNPISPVLEITIHQNRILPYIFLAISLLSIILLFRELFSTSIGILAAIVFLSNSTFIIVNSYIFYYYLSLFFLIKYIKTKNKMAILCILPLLVATYITHTSSFFAILVILIATSISYMILNLFDHNMNQKQILVNAIIISMIGLISLVIVSVIGGNIINDFSKNFPKVVERVIFYLLSYERSTYFYLYIIEKSILFPLTIVFIFTQLKLLYMNKISTTNKFVLSYFFSFILLSIFLGFTNVFARTFDYFLPLLGVLTFYELYKYRWNNKIVLTFLVTALLIVSLVHFTVPPRSLEKYDSATISGLQFATESENIFTDTFLANVLLSYLHYYDVNGLEYGMTAKINALYYTPDESEIYDEFREKNTDYFIISKHSLTRGLDILNAPHFLMPIESVSKYDSMVFLDKVYSNRMIWIWKFMPN
ncbi:MAG: hypothetical protein ABIG84_06170 [archaeon]